MSNKIEELTDEQLNEYATRFIMRKCWHEFSRNSVGSPVCNKCNKTGSQTFPNENYTFSHQFTFELIVKLNRRIVDENFEINFAAFSIHLKSRLLPSNHYANPQTLYHEEIFLLYLIKPRQIVEACLLAVNYEKLITGE